MRIVTILATALAAISTGAYAGQTYDGYDAFYIAQEGALFNAPVKQDRGTVYANSDKEGIYTNLQTTIFGKTARIQIAPNRITINGKTYKFAQATTFPNERTGDIYPDTANVFVEARTGNRPSLLCLDGHGGGSGEADRYQQIFLLMDPLGHKPTFLHLPGLLSSCRAVLVTSSGQIAFPKNSYLLNEAQDTRIGLLVSYFTFAQGNFIPTKNEIRLRFASPENPFKFSREN